ncbi:cupredoxin domain-containing protein [Candidatus Woesearchaeota archaeon]|nr:cupredoxin domain-containing protein [Candidatus Woesearchaeota archaeon]
MKWSILFAILAVMLLVGCAKPAEEPAPIAEEQEPVIEEIVEEPEPEVTPATREEITVMNRAVEPTALTVGAGSTIVFKMDSGVVGGRTLQVKKVGFSERSPSLRAGDSWEITLAETGEYQFIDIIMGSKGTITVVE